MSIKVEGENLTFDRFEKCQQYKNIFFTHLGYSLNFTVAFHCYLMVPEENFTCPHQQQYKN